MIRRTWNIWHRLLFVASAAFVCVPALVTEAADLEKISVRMDWVISGYHAPFFVGVEKGFYKDVGLDVTVEPGNGSGVVAQAIGNGNGTFAAVDGGTMMNLVSKGLPVKSIMGILQRSPLAVVYATNSGINEPKDLEDKTLGVTNGEAPLILLPAFLKATGVDESKVKLVNADPASKDTMLLLGQVNAVLNFNFLAVPPLEENGLDVGTLDYADYGVNVPGLSLIARSAYLEENADIAERFVGATVRAYEWSMANPEEAIDILIAANPGDKIPRSSSLRILQLSFDLHHTQATEGMPFGVMAIEDWRAAEELLAEYQGVKKVPNPSEYFTNAFVQP